MRYLASLLLFVFCFAPLSAHAETNLGERLKGRILLQVESHGEAWYVNPKDGLRYYMPDGEAAYTLMRQESLGITNADLKTIPSTPTVDQIKETESVCASHDLAQRVAGHILLQVEDHGEAWYVDPDTCTRIYMKDGQVAYSIMHDLSLGITNDELATIGYNTLYNSIENTEVTVINNNTGDSTTVVNIIEVEKVVTNDETETPTADSTPAESSATETVSGPIALSMWARAHVNDSATQYDTEVAYGVNSKTNLQTSNQETDGITDDHTIWVKPWNNSVVKLDVSVNLNDYPGDFTCQRTGGIGESWSGVWEPYSHSVTIDIASAIKTFWDTKNALKVTEYAITIPLGITCTTTDGQVFTDYININLSANWPYIYIDGALYDIDDVPLLG